ncbi:MAG: DNA alkylation repair protein [Bacteroidetes bacterium]|nr:DNA alkylation repair protein [Bacteroidota bacterium]
MEAKHLICEALKDSGNLVHRIQMEQYLRNQFAFLGVMSTRRKEILRQLKKRYLDTLNPQQKRKLVASLWAEEHREYQLFALDWMKKWNAQDYLETDIEFFEGLILQKPWWDTVDIFAPNLVGKYAKRFPKKMRAVLKRWENHRSYWLRRSCLIFQLRYRRETDLELLQHFVHSLAQEKEFFIQKAIGWSLREVSKWNPVWVQHVVLQEQLEGLARREALKYVQ